MSLIEISDLDQIRFGIKVAKTNRIDVVNIHDILTECKSQDVKLLIARCEVNDVKSVYAMESNGFNLMQTLIYLRFDLTKKSIPQHQSNVIVREVKPSEADLVEKVARDSFKDYLGHYHADPKLNPSDSTEVYSSWAKRCCIDPAVADCVYVAEFDNKIVGFRAIRVNSPSQSEFLLAGVSPDYQSKGIYKSFVVEGLNWCKEIGASEVINSTLIFNYGVLNVCSQLGFVPKDAFYVFHKWIE